MAYDPRQYIPKHFHREPGSNQVVSPNEREILSIVRQGQGISRSEITERTNLTQQSVYRLVEAMRERGMLNYGDPKPGTGRGQPSPTLWLNPDFALSAGVSLNTDAIVTCLFDFAGNIRSTELIENLDTPIAIGLKRINASIDSQIKSQKLSANRLFGAGLSITGFLHEGTTYNTPLPLHEWSLIELGPLISDLLALPVWVGNSANTAAVCEQMLGIGRYISNFAYLSMNYGFGGAAIVNGELLHGGHGNAGELSIICHDVEMSKRPALQFLVKTLQSEGIDISSVEDIRLNYDPTWPGVDTWIQDVSPTLNQVANSLYAVLDPQAIVIGGQIPKQLANQLISTIEFSKQPRHGRQIKSPKLMVSELDVNSSAVGAALMPFKEIFF